MRDNQKNWKNEYGRPEKDTYLQEIDNYWWKQCYDEIENFVIKKIPLIKDWEIAECGSGSGNSSLRMSKRVKKITLVDSSKNALEYSKKLAKIYNADNVEYALADIFNAPFPDGSFDFCWNVGVIEHYKLAEAEKILREMIRITKDGGFICVGVPNFNSLPILKAKILSSKFGLKFLPRAKGYRLQDERRNDENQIKQMLAKACDENGASITQLNIGYAGSVLPVETPKIIFKTLNGLCNQIFKQKSFLIMLSAKINKNI